MASNGIIDPTSGQSESSIGCYLDRCKIGDEVAIRETHGGALNFVLTTITVIKLESGRVYTDASGYGGSDWYKRHGRSCFYPKGQSHLVEPTDEIRGFLEQYPSGVVGTYLAVQIPRLESDMT